MRPDEGEIISSFTSNWSVHETLEEAERQYSHVLDFPLIYVAAISEVTKSTLYSYQTECMKASPSLPCK